MVTFNVGEPIDHPVHGHGTVDCVFASSGRFGISFEGDGYLLLKADRLQAELEGKSHLAPSRVTVPIRLKKPSLRMLLFQASMTAGSSARLVSPVDAERRQCADSRLTLMERLLPSAFARWFFATGLMAIYATNSKIIPHHGPLFLLQTLPFMFMLALLALAWGFIVLGLLLLVLRKIT